MKTDLDFLIFPYFFILFCFSYFSGASVMEIEKVEWKSCQKSLCYQLKSDHVSRSTLSQDKTFAENVTLSIFSQNKENGNTIIREEVKAPRAIFQSEKNSWVLIEARSLKWKKEREVLFLTDTMKLLMQD